MYKKTGQLIVLGAPVFGAIAYKLFLLPCLLISGRRCFSLFYRLFLVAGLLLPGLLVSQTAAAEGVLAANKILQSNPTPFTGETVEYRLEFSCSGITGDCGGLNILDTIPAELEIVSCIAPPGFSVNTCTPGTNDIDISKDLAFGDGEAFTVTIRTRVRLDAPAGPTTPAVNVADVTIVDGPGGAPQTQSPAADPVIIQPGVPHYRIFKIRTEPTPPLEPAPDTDIVYTVRFCAQDGIGNIDVNNPVLTDTLPVGAVVVDPDGGTVVGNVITWDLNDFDLATAYASPADTSVRFCQNRTYIVNYPSASFPEGTPIVNTVVGTGDPEGGGTPFPNPGDDTADISEVTGAANPGAGMGKSASDVAAGAGNGPMVWSLEANIASSNVPVLDLVVYEEIPATPAELFPLQVTSGTWNSPLNSQGQSDVQATIQFTNTPVATQTISGTVLNPAAPTDCSAIPDAQWTDLSAGQIASPAAGQTYPLPVDATCIRWVFVDASSNAAAPAIPLGWVLSELPRLSIDTQGVPGPYPIQVDNCMYSYFDADSAPGGAQSVDGPTCGDANIESPTPALNALKSRVSPQGDLAAGQEFIQRLSFEHIVGDSTGPTVNPIYADLLPPELEFVRWNSYAGNPPEPVMEVIEDYLGTGRTLVRYSWSNSAPAGSVNLDGSDATGSDNSASYPETLTPVQMPQMDIVLQVKPGTSAGSYTNNADLFDNSPIPANCSNTRSESNAGPGGTPIDLNGDGDATDNFCVGTADISVIQAAVLGGKKFVMGSGNPALPNVDDPTVDPVVVNSACEGAPNGLTRFPCVAQTGRAAPNNTFSYEIELTNNGNVLLEDYYLYDVLPHVGDTGTGPALSNTARESTWNPAINGDITFIAGTFLDINGMPLDLAAHTTGPFAEYSTAANPCRNELEGDFADPWPAGCDNTYSATLPADPSTVTAFRIRMPFDLQPWPAGATLRYNVPMAAPPGSPPSIADDPTLFNPAWNSFAHRAREDDALPGSGGLAIPASEPRKTGIILEPNYRIGNLIWLDTDNDGIAEAGEPGIAGVDIQIWEDTDDDGVPSAGDTLINTTTTDADGKYLFDDLAPGGYYVLVPEGQDGAGDALEELFQSTAGEEADPDGDGDNNDNGVNDAVTAGSGMDQTTGLASGVVTLGVGGAFSQSEPTDETLRSDDATDDDDDAFPDTLSNFSIDIGYYRPFNLGNRVWLDNGDDGTGTLDPALANNGLLDPGENGIDGITVTLLNADSSVYDSDPDTAGIQPLTTTTANDGYYLFENLPAGDYRVQLDLSGGNEHLKSSTGANAASGPFEPAPDPDDDNDSVDDGTQTSPTIVTSGIVTLGAADVPAEPLGETDVDASLANPQGNDPADNPIPDDQANMTVDFGLFESYSIGNRVWIEDDNNGIFDAGEAPTDGIGVRLFEDFNNDGVPDGPAIASTTTANGGHYRFDNLVGGTYIVETDIPAGTRSSEIDHGDPDNDIDSDDNGSVVDAGAGTVRSLPVTVGSVGPVEPLDDAETGPGDDGSGSTAAPDGHSNLSVDFGFVREYSVGSYVWDDINGDGIQDPGELPIPGALVELVDAAGAPVVDMDGLPVVPQLTGPDGLYFFETLPAGDYRVRVTPPVQYAPSPVQTTADNDDTANDSNIASAFDVDTYESGLFTLGLGAEPTEAGGLPGDDQDAIADGNGNMTIDFGFYEPLTLGNLVWEDTDNDGLFNNGEVGVDGVSVELYRDTNGDGILDIATDEQVGTTTTAGGGFYQFNDLIADDYFVFIPDTNTDPGGPLAGLVSSTGPANSFEPAPDPDDTDTDNDDSGTLDLTNGGFASLPVTLSANTEPGSEDPTLEGTPGFDGTLVNGLPHDDADSNLAVDFGFTPSMALGSVVFIDNDDSGIQEPGEPGIPGTTVQLFDATGVEIPVGPDGILGTADDAPGGVTTNAAGEYNFSGLAPGDYVVRVTPADTFAPSSNQIADPNTDTNLDSNIDTSRTPPPGSYESGVVTLTPAAEPTGADENDPDGVIEVDPSGTQDDNANLTVDFGFVQPVSIGSLVWVDTNGNGLQDPGEPGLTEGTVELLDASGTPVALDLDGNAIVPVDLSTTGGQYIFDNLRPGDYKIRVIPTPGSGYVPSLSQTTADDDDAELDSNISTEPTPGSYESGVFTLLGGGEPIEAGTGLGDDQDDPGTGIASEDSGNMTVDFGFIKPLSIGSYVWEDTNGDGTQDATEVGINGATVTLLVDDGTGNFVSATDLTGAPVAPVVTANDGSDDGVYQFTNLPPGDYKVQVSNLPAGFSPSGTQQTADNDDTATDSNVASEPAPGIFESGVFSLGVNTEPDAGIETQPGDAQDDTDDINGNMTVDFGFAQTVSLGSYVWEDTNADGIQDAGEPAILGATVSLLVEDPAVPGTFIPAVDISSVAVVDQVTGADGQYFFDSLPEGNYKVQVTPPALYVPTLVQNGADDDDTADDSNINTTPLVAPPAGTFESGIFALEFGSEPETADGETLPGDDQDDAADDSGNMTVDFGFIRPLSIGSYVWEDANNDGTQQAAEQAVENAVVELFVDDGTGNFVPVNDIDGVPVVSQNTGTTGLYNFTKLPPGDYKVVVTPEAGKGFIPATPQTTADNDDSETDSNILPGTSSLSVLADPSYESPVFTLAMGTEPDEGGAEVGDDQDDAAETDGNMTVDFGFVRPVSIGSVVWEDADQNGIQDDVEAGIPGATVTLLVDDGAGNFIPTVDIDDVNVPPAVTDSNGNYLFDNLPAGDYKVQVTPPAGYLPSPVQNGADEDPIANDSNIAGETAPDSGVFESGVFSLAPDTESDESTSPSALPNNGDDQDDAAETNGDMTVDFGFVQAVSIGSTVFLDNNNDAQHGVDEPGIGGIDVQLFRDGDDPTGPPFATTTTDQAGNYFFGELLPGDYFIVIPTPPLEAPLSSTGESGIDDINDGADVGVQTLSGDPAISPVISLAVGTEPDNAGETEPGTGGSADDTFDTNGDMTVDFGFVPPASLGNRVWLDLDKDGVQDANEDGIAGVTVNLLEDTDGDGTPETVVGTLITGPDGGYLFPNLQPGVAYQVAVDDSTLPPNLVQTFDEGPTPGVTGPLDHTSDIIVLEPNEEHLTADFGYAPPPGSIGDTIWIDADGDGIQDPGELGIPNVTVNLLDVDGNIIDTLITDAQGKYLFTDKPEGIYGVEVDITTLPPGYTAHPNGDPDVRDGVTTVADNVTTVQLETLPDGTVESNLDADFGYEPPADQNNSIGDTVWFDINGDGVQGPAEAGITGVTLTLFNDAGEPIASTTTDDQGMYLFTGVPDGSYTVMVTDANSVLDGLTQTFDNDGLGTPNQSTVTDIGVGVATPVEDLDQDFGYTPTNSSPAANTGVIGDTIYFDVDGDGTQGASEGGIEGVTVELRDDAGNLIGVAVTDENGHYLFTGLEVSDSGVNYTVTVRTDTLPGGGANWANSGDPDGGLDSTSAVSLTTAAPVDLDQDFGYGGGINSLQGTIWPDNNEDGVQDESTTFEGITVVLLDPDTGNIIARATTDANGDYEFINLPDGLYTMLVTDDGNILAGFEHTDGEPGVDKNSQADDGTYIVDLDSAGVIDNPVIDVTSDSGYKPTLTTPITLGSFESEALSAGDVRFSWTTQSEIANAGFMIYQKVGEDWLVVNEDIIPAVGESLETVSYNYTGHQIESSEFVLVDVDTRGKQTLHGPFALGQRFGVVDKAVLKSSSSALRAHIDDRSIKRKRAAERSFKSRLDSYLGR